MKEPIKQAWIHKVPVKHESDMNLELSKNMLKLHEHLKIISDKYHGLSKSQSLDLMFIMDCTSSMSSWIKVCKKEIESIVTRITSQNKGCDVRLSFVGYTDFDQKRNGMFDILDFTSSPVEFTNFMKDVKARGGADAPEDVVGGLQVAMR